MPRMHIGPFMVMMKFFDISMAAKGIFIPELAIPTHQKFKVLMTEIRAIGDSME